jgi:hypothetical protein
MATLTINLTDAQMAHLIEEANITNQDPARYLAALIDEDVTAKTQGWQDAGDFLDEDVPGGLLGEAAAIGGGARRSVAPWSPWDELGNCWLY